MARIAAGALLLSIVLSPRPCRSEELHSLAPANSTVDSVTVESSLRTKLNWTELALRGDRPKAWDEISSPEARVSARVLNGLFEGKLELGLLTDQFTHFDASSTYSLKAELQLGVRLGSWSILGEWKGRDVYSWDDADFVVGLQTYDIRARKRFSESLLEGLAPAQMQLSAAVGYNAAIPALFRRNLAEMELEVLQPLGNGFSVLVAPKIELGDYTHFNGRDREDATLSLRVVPAYTFSNGVMLSMEGQATVAFSTLETKAGESWGLTPIIRVQQSF